MKKKKFLSTQIKNPLVHFYIIFFFISIQIGSKSNSSNDSRSDEDNYEEFLKQVLEEKTNGKTHRKAVSIKSIDLNESLQSSKLHSNQEKAMEMFSNISDDNLALLYFVKYSFKNLKFYLFILKPILLLILWLYYDESQIGSNYSITKQTYIYYFLFSLTSMPVQICIDILFYNLLENYHDYDFESLLKQAKIRFNTRNNLWKGDDNDIDLKIEKKARTKAQIFLSPQFFFMVTLHVSGLTLITVGVIIMIANNYRIFNDLYLPLVLIFWVSILKVIEMVCFYAGKKFKIWKVSGTLN